MRHIHEGNKFSLVDAYMSPAEANTFVIDFPEQIIPLYQDKHSPKLNEEFQMM